MHNGNCEVCPKETIFDSSARRCIPKTSPKQASKGASVKGGKGPEADAKGRRIGGDVKDSKKDDMGQNFLYGGFDVMTDKPPQPVVIEIWVKQKVRRLGKSSKKGNKWSKKGKNRRKLVKKTSETNNYNKDERKLKRRKKKKGKKGRKSKNKGGIIIERALEPNQFNSTEEKGVTYWKSNVTFKAPLWPNSKFDIKIKAKTEDPKFSKNYKIMN